MPADIVPLQPQTVDPNAKAETKTKAAILAWIDSITDIVIAAAREDAALRFQDKVADEELSSLDFKGREFDPIVDEPVRGCLTPSRNLLKRCGGRKRLCAVSIPTS
jgi:hypothetical protein